MVTAFCRARVIAFLLLATNVAAQEMPKDQPPLWSARPEAVAFDKMENDRLAAAARAIDQLVVVKGSRTIETPWHHTTKQFGSLIRQAIFPV